MAHGRPKRGAEELAPAQPLAKDLEGLIAAFAGVPRPAAASLRGCPQGCCISKDEIARLVAMDPRDPDLELALSYADAALMTAGEVADLAYLLPLLLHVYAQSIDRPGGAFVERFHAALFRAVRAKGGDAFVALGLDARAREGALAFLRARILGRIGRERSLDVRGMSPTHDWPSLVAAYGAYAPNVKALLEPLFRAESPGLAVALVQYASTFAFGADDNPIFKRWTPNKGGGPLALDDQASIAGGQPWLEANLADLGAMLTPERLRASVVVARERLPDDQARGRADAIAQALAANEDGVRERIAELLDRLERPEW